MKLFSEIFVLVFQTTCFYILKNEKKNLVFFCFKSIANDEAIFPYERQCHPAHCVLS